MSYTLDHQTPPTILLSHSAPSWLHLPLWLALRPRRAMQTLAIAPDWIVILPVVLALALAYLRFLAVALLLPADPMPGLLGALAQLSVGWLVRALVVMVLIVLMGGHSTIGRVYRLTVWAGLPLLLRQGLQILYLLYTGVQPDSPGLSGLIDSGLARQVLGYLDLYNLWFAILLAAAVSAATILTQRRAWLGVLLYSAGAILFAMLLKALATVLFPF